MGQSAGEGEGEDGGGSEDERGFGVFGGDGGGGEGGDGGRKNMLLGLVAEFTACMTSGLAGVYLEKVCAVNPSQNLSGNTKGTPLAIGISKSQSVSICSEKLIGNFLRICSIGFPGFRVTQSIRC